MRWSLHDAGRRADLKDRLARLRPDATARWGRMSVDQMLWHLATVLSAATGSGRTSRRATSTTT